jgi:hypothetical protein
MKDKYKILILFILKLLAVIFLISAIGSFITTIIYNIKNDTDNIVFFIFTNLSVTLFYRAVMAVFFFVFAIFIEDWLKSE